MTREQMQERAAWLYDRADTESNPMKAGEMLAEADALMGMVEDIELDEEMEDLMDLDDDTFDDPIDFDPDFEVGDYD